MTDNQDPILKEDLIQTQNISIEKIIQITLDEDGLPVIQTQNMQPFEIIGALEASRELYNLRKIVQPTVKNTLLTFSQNF